MDLDFIEIGSSCYETLCESCSDTEKGMTIEPIKEYLDKLPNKINVIKINIAITANRTSDKITMYYLSDEYINNSGLNTGFRGLNNVYGIHPAIRGSYHEYFVGTIEVPVLNIEELLINYNIRKIGFLKIDTEGHDCVILGGLFEYLKNKDREYYPKKIQFESNHLTDPTHVDTILSSFSHLGYKIESRGHDSILVLS